MNSVRASLIGWMNKRSFHSNAETSMARALSVSCQKLIVALLLLALLIIEFSASYQIAGSGLVLGGGHEIRCQKNKPVQISDHIVGVSAKIKRCFKCTCPKGFIKCYQLKHKTECNWAVNSTVRTEHLDEATQRPMTAEEDNRVSSVRPITRRAQIIESGLNTTQTIKIGKIVYHHSSQPEPDHTGKVRNETHRLHDTADALGVEPDKLTRKLQDMKLQLKDRQSTTNSRAAARNATQPLARS